MIQDRVVIETLPTQVVGKTIIIGDIHGCLHEFNNLLTACNFNKEIDRVIHVGDLVNKGYDSRGVVLRCLELGALGVVGNHDDTLLECIRDSRYFDQRDMKDPVKRTAKKFPGHLTDYLKNLPHILKIPQYNLIVAHAGINPYLSLEDQDPMDLTNMRRVMADGKAVRKGSPDGVAWAKVWSGPETVVFGHDAKAGLQEEEFALGLDTGCCYGDRLTAVIYPGRKLVHVPGAKPMNAKTPKTTPQAEGAETPQTPAYGEYTPSEGLMTPSMVRTHSRPSMSGAGGTPSKGSASTTPNTIGGSSPPPQWPAQPPPAVTTSNSLPGLKIAGRSESERTPPTVNPPANGAGFGTGGGNVAAFFGGMQTTNSGAAGSSSTAGGGGGGGEGNSSSPSGNTEVRKLRKEVLDTKIFTLRTIGQSKQVKVLLELLTPGGLFDDTWYEFIAEPDVPITMWKDVLWCLATGLGDASLDEEAQERCLNLLQDVLIDREDVKVWIAGDLKKELLSVSESVAIKAQKAFKATMIALR